MMMLFEGQTEGNYVNVHGYKCGQVFDKMATIHEALSENPILELSAPLGFNAVKTIIEQWEVMKPRVQNIPR